MNNLEENKKVARAFYEYFCTTESDRVGKGFDMLSEDSMWCLKGHNTCAMNDNTGGFIDKKIFMFEMLKTGGSLHPERDSNSTFPFGMQQYIYSEVAEGDLVILEVQSLGFTQVGDVYNNYYSFHFRIRDGKIYECIEYSDTGHANRLIRALNQANS